MTDLMLESLSPSTIRKIYKIKVYDRSHVGVIVQDVKNLIIEDVMRQHMFYS